MGTPVALTSVVEPQLEVEFAPLTVGAKVPPWWQSLFQNSPNQSVFLSEAWLQSWLDAYLRDFGGRWIQWMHEGTTVGGCILLTRVAWKGLVPVRSLFINATGEGPERTPLAEFNDILHVPGYEQAIAADLARIVKETAWARVLISGYTEQSLLAFLIPLLPAALVEHDPQPAPYINLAALPNAPFEMSLTGRAGSQVRRNSRLYEKRYGPCKVKSASSLDQALHFFEEMAILHRASWESKGHRGSFSNNAALNFHRALIRRLWPVRGVDLLCVSNGESVSGYLYNFTSEDKVYYFQSGFAYRTDCNLSPGIFTHSMAIEHYRQQGLLEYDFLAGDVRYKRSLTRERRLLQWTTVYRDSAWARFILRLRATRPRLMRAVRQVTAVTERT